MKFDNEGNTLKCKHMQNYYEIKIRNKVCKIFKKMLLFISIHPKLMRPYQNELDMLPLFWATEKIFKMVSFVESLMFDSQVIAVFFASVQSCTVSCKYDL